MSAGRLSTLADSGSCAGGGLYVARTAMLTNVKVLSNPSNAYGGPSFGDRVYVQGAATIANGQVQSNTCTNGSCMGGGLYVGDTLPLTDARFTSNTTPCLAASMPGVR